MLAALKSRSVQMTELLLSHKANPNASMGSQQFIYAAGAAMIGSIPICEALIKAGLDKASYAFACRMAAAKGHGEFVEFLVKAGADPSEALLGAASRGQLPLVKLALSLRANPKIATPTSAVGAALETKQMEIVAFLAQVRMLLRP